MSTKLYVGNLTYGTDNDALGAMFSNFGEISSAQVITDRDTGRSKGFGFVEFGDAKAAQSAITAMDGKDVGGRSLTVNEARPREDRGGGRSSGYQGGGSRRY
jgi:RNA recognition motif-containing protein